MGLLNLNHKARYFYVTCCNGKKCSRQEFDCCRTASQQAMSHHSYAVVRVANVILKFYLFLPQALIILIKIPEQNPGRILGTKKPPVVLSWELTVTAPFRAAP